MPEYINRIEPTCEVDHILFNNIGNLPEEPPRPIVEYDFQIVQIPLRSVLPERSYFCLSHEDINAHKQLFHESIGRLTLILNEMMRWNAERNILSFVTNFMIPQQNPMGKLLPRYDFRNFVYFIEKLNESLSNAVTGNFRNAHIVDVDQICSTYGRKYLQDDAIQSQNHGAGLHNDGDTLDSNRIEPPGPIAEYYTIRDIDFQNAFWAELRALHRTIRQVDQVKLVIADLDDTLWRGLAVENQNADAGAAVEGWPLGLAEALMFLKRRGILLGIASKNDEKRIEGIWNHIWGGRLRLSDFAVRRINWSSKIDNIQSILQEVNLLARSAVYIDDNPVERAAVTLAFPDIRLDRAAARTERVG